VRVGLGPRRIDEGGTLTQIVVAEQALRIQVACRGITYVALRIGVGEFHRLDLQMQALHRIRLKACQIELTQDSQRDLRRDPLAIRRNLVQRLPVVVQFERRHPLRLVRGQIIRRHGTPLVGGMGGDGSGQLASIERFTPGGGDRLQCARLIFKAEDLPRCGWTTVA